MRPQEALSAAPAALSGLDVSLRKDGALAITYRTGENSIEQLLGIREAGVSISDLATEEPDLEDVFVSLTSWLNMAGWDRRIAQINVATFRLARKDKINADFEAALDEVNALAEAAPGFVWRMPGEGESDDPHTRST